MVYNFSFSDRLLTENNDNGIRFAYSSLGTTIEDNTISDNVNCGILIDESSLGNTVKGNTIENNDFGVKCIGVSDGNTFHHNSFIGNNQHAYDSCMDIWDDECMGNYWDDYTGVDSDGNGIGDTPYDVPGGDNKDRFPLMNPSMMTVTVEGSLREETNGESGNAMISTVGSSSDNGWDIIVPDDYLTIQEAVDHADEGNRIFVKCGTYNENIVIDKPFLTLQGEGNDCVIIDGNDNPADVIKIIAAGVDVSGFTIRNAGGGYSGVLAIDMSSLISDCIIKNCTYGISLFLGGNNKVINNSLNGLNPCQRTDS